jgi:hypothetical protein
VNPEIEALLRRAILYGWAAHYVGTHPDEAIRRFLATVKDGQRS